MGNLSKEDNVCQYVIKRPLPLKEGKKQKYAAPKVQRLVTPIMLQRKRHRLALKQDVPKRTVKQLQNMPRSWLKGKRKLRRQRSFEERDPPLIGKAEHQKAQSASDLWM